MTTPPPTALFFTARATRRLKPALDKQTHGKPVDYKGFGAGAESPVSIDAPIEA